MAHPLKDYSTRDKLFKAIRYHYHDVLEVYRGNRTELIAHAAGDLYSKYDIEKKVFLNLLQQAEKAHTIGISANRPRVAIYAKRPELASFARHFQVALNNLGKQMRIEQTFEEIARDSFYGPAFGKVYLGDAPEVEIESDVWMNPGQPHFSRLSFDDTVYDTSAKDFRKCTFIADRYRLPWRVVMEDKERFNSKVISQLGGQKWTAHDGEESGNTEYLSKEMERVSDGDYEPMVDLIDVWLPADRMIATWLMRPGFWLHHSEPISVQEWPDDAPETGPYKMLSMGPVPDNILPAAPAWHLKWQHEQVNMIYRKCARQAERLKIISTYDPGDEDYAEDYRKASDGDMLASKQGVHESRTGGVDNNLLGYAQVCTNTFDRQADNLSLRAGLGPQTDTASQDQLLNARATRMEEGAQSKMVRFATEVYEDLARLMFDDPVMHLPGEIEVEGTQFTVTSDWLPAMEEGAREGKWNDYEYCVEPYSMAYQSPGQKAQAIKQTVMELVPLLPILQQQGIQFDLNAYLRLMSDMTDTPELKQIFKSNQIPVQTVEAGGHERSLPSNSTRNYVRTNRGSMRQSPTSNEAVISKMGNQPQGSAA